MYLQAAKNPFFFSFAGFCLPDLPSKDTFFKECFYEYADNQVNNAAGRCAHRAGLYTVYIYIYLIAFNNSHRITIF